MTIFRYKREDALIICLSGYYNNVRRRFLKSIYGVFSKAGYCHYVDIDAGVFEIYRNLKRKMEIIFRMYKMDLKTLQTYRKYGRPLNENDRRRLEQIQEMMKEMNVIVRLQR